MRVLQTFLPILVDQGSGHIVTTGPTAGLFPYAYDRLPYVATKAAVVALTESLALYARPRGISVTCFCPAGVMTNIVEQIREYGPPIPIQPPQLPVVNARMRVSSSCRDLRETSLRPTDPWPSDDSASRHGPGRILDVADPKPRGTPVTGGGRGPRSTETFSEVAGIPAPNRGDDYVATLSSNRSLKRSRLDRA